MEKSRGKSRKKIDKILKNLKIFPILKKDWWIFRKKNDFLKVKKYRKFVKI